MNSETAEMKSNDEMILVVLNAIFITMIEEKKPQ